MECTKVTAAEISCVISSVRGKIERVFAKKKPNFLRLKQQGSFPSFSMKRGGAGASGNGAGASGNGAGASGSGNGDNGWKYVDQQLCAMYGTDKILFTELIKVVKEELDVLNIPTHLEFLGVQLWKHVMCKALDTVFEGRWPVEKVGMLPGEYASFTFKNVTLEEDDEVVINVDQSAFIYEVKGKKMMVKNHYTTLEERREKRKNEKKTEE